MLRVYAVPMNLSTLLSAKNRTWLYGVAAAVVAVLIGYGLISSDAGPLWLSLIAAVLWALANLTAILHTESTGRAALYGVALAVMALLTYYKVVDEAQAGVWAGLAAAVFGVGSNVLALAHVTPDETKDDLVNDFDPNSTDYPDTGRGGFTDDGPLH